jgi:hypothetical protein
MTRKPAECPAYFTQISTVKPIPEVWFYSANFVAYTTSNDHQWF